MEKTFRKKMKMQVSGNEKRRTGKEGSKEAVTG